MELGCSQAGSAWDGWGQEEPQAEQKVPLPFLLVWGALPPAPNTGDTQGQPLPPGAVSPAQMESVPRAASTRLSKIWPLVAKACGGERIEGRRSVCNNSGFFVVR